MTPEVLVFRRSEPEELVVRMAELAAQGAGWVNLHPRLGEGEAADVAAARPQGPFARVFSSRGPSFPSAAWVPGRRRKGRAAPDEVGLEHGAGPRARERLAEAGVAIPPGWVVRQDHPKRGLVLALPGGAPPGEILAFVFAAADALAPAPLPEQWAARIYSG